MKNILFLVDRYLPYPSSNGACVYNLIQEVNKRGDNAVVISHFDSSGENVYCLNAVCGKVSVFNKLFGFFENKGLVKSFCDLATELDKKFHFDCVVSTFRPAECVLAGIYIEKKLKIKHFPIFFDLFGFGNNGKFREFLFRRSYIKLLNKLSKNGDVYILKFYRELFSKYKNIYEKLIPIGIPEIVDKTESKKGEDKIKLLYAGSFSPQARNPSKMFDSLSILGEDKNVFMEVYSSFGCWDILEKYKEKYGEGLSINTQIPISELHDKMSVSDVLINLSNDCLYQVPGKFYDLCSTGKPIINFIFRRDDAGLEEYYKYPLSLNVFLNENYNKEDINKFIINSKNLKIDFEKVKEIFYDSTPEFLINDFYRNLK